MSKTHPASSSPRYTVENIFPAEEIHLITGPCGSGKSTLMVQSMWDWSRGKDVFGHKSYPGPFCYVSANRSRSSMRHQMRSLGIDPDLVPHFSILENTTYDDRNMKSLLELARALVPGMQALFITGLNILCGKVTDERIVADFLSDILRSTQQHHYTLHATSRSAKMREGDMYESPRDRTVGSGVWNELTSTKLIVEFVKPRNPVDPYRSVHLLPRLWKPQTLAYKFSETGGLVERGIDQGDFPQATVLDAWLQQHVAQEFTTGELLAMADAQGIGDRTVYRWLETQCELGCVKKIVRGRYIVPSVITEQ